MIEFIDSQLADWPLARQNYQALGQTERKTFTLGDITVGVQHNPARIVSTAAKTDAASVAARPCFLCKKNRPPQQTGEEFIKGWELLLNPYPIFPTHFTIVSTTHQPQAGFQLDMIEMAEKLPGMTVFFNGSQAGASCPDHLHCQAVKTLELPLMQLLEKRHLYKADMEYDEMVVTAKSLGLDLPFDVISIIVPPTIEGMDILENLEHIIGSEYIDSGMVNIFVWIDGEGHLRIAAVPRNSWRPSCYFAEDDSKLTISPGCIDMVGVMIVPLKEDYDKITAADVSRIYGECGVKEAILGKGSDEL